MAKPPPRWDGVDHQLWARIVIVCGAFSMWMGRFPDRSDDEGMSGFTVGLFLLLAGLFMIPEGPQPPDD